MKYFELIQDKRVERPIFPYKIDGSNFKPIRSEKAFVLLESIQLARYSGESFEEVCDLLEEPILLCSDILKRALSKLETRIQWKTVQVHSKKVDGDSLGLYWIPWFPEVDGLHVATTRYPNGLFKKIVLDGDKIKEYNVFQVTERIQRKIMVSLQAAEVLLRDRYYGIGFRKVEVY